MVETNNELLNKKPIIEKIHIIREVQVMLDSDIAELHGYEVKKLNQQVKRNIERFQKTSCFS